jgi:GNAT superfamily N-acetyltransferase
MNPEKIIIRKAVEADYKAIDSLYYRTYSLYHENIPDCYKETPKTVLSRGDFINILDSEDDIMLVAEDDGKVIGQLYGMVEHYEGGDVTTDYHRVEVAELSVDPEYERIGVGSKLIKEVEKWTKEKKLCDLAVLTYAFNKKAISFYEANGYEQYSIKLQKKI